ncbi:MAG: C39 family peptidase [Candidatus Peribacteraceae bacterium]|nr:C39 family peptidase [Candidatus Peribacteraceae bacterium]
MQRYSIRSLSCGLSIFLVACSIAPSKEKPLLNMASNNTQQSSSSAKDLQNTRTDEQPGIFNPHPSFVRLSVPFSPQAPFANWDALHEETCEEMSLVMIRHFLDGAPLSREQAENEIQELVSWEMANGYSQDVTIRELAEIARKRYGLRAVVEHTVTEERIKELLSQGHPIIVPAAGRDLQNPYFSGLGPWYHMLVITGYTPIRFITNDPGTRRGEDYSYKLDILLSAIHDWTGVKENIREGEKAMLIVMKP